LSADYSQIELRLAAVLSGDETMVKAFKKNEDIHKRTASEIFDIDLEKVDSQSRRWAKAINFGIIYGQGPKALSEQTGISFSEAREYIKKYFELRPGIKSYLAKCIENARKKGYAQTYFKRRRYIPEIDSNLAVLRSAAERIAVNMPLQGTAADLIKIAMRQVYDYIKNNYKKDDIKMLLQVHDELVFEIKNNLVGGFAKTLFKIMENPSYLKTEVPITIDIEIGNDWLNLKKIN
jgi:DNA polymerase-1